MIDILRSCCVDFMEWADTRPLAGWRQAGISPRTTNPATMDAVGHFIANISGSTGCIVTICTQRTMFHALTNFNFFRLQSVIMLMLCLAPALPSSPANAAEIVKVMQDPGPIIPGEEEPCNFDIKPLWNDFKRGKPRTALHLGLLLGVRRVIIRRDKEGNPDEIAMFGDALLLNYISKKEEAKKKKIPFWELNEKYYRMKRNRKTVLRYYWQVTAGLTDNYMQCMNNRKAMCWDFLAADGLLLTREQFIAEWDAIITDDFEPQCQKRGPVPHTHSTKPH